MHHRRKKALEADFSTRVRLVSPPCRAPSIRRHQTRAEGFSTSLKADALSFLRLRMGDHHASSGSSMKEGTFKGVPATHCPSLARVTSVQVASLIGALEL